MDNESIENVELFMSMLDEKSRKIFWYFLCHRHASLDELVKLVKASSDMEVLHRLKEVINTSAMQIFDSPVLEFNKSKIDQSTGNKVLFNWWLVDFIGIDKFLNRNNREHLVDIFDEEDQLIIISELSPSIKVSDKAKIEQRNGILIVKLDKVCKGGDS